MYFRFYSLRSRRKRFAVQPQAMGQRFPLAPALKAALPWTPPSAIFVSCRYCLKRQIGAVTVCSVSIPADAQTEVCIEATDVRNFCCLKSISMMEKYKWRYPQMPNPILPLWEYIPDGEPRVFGDRVYLYGSHDRPACDVFCDFKLKVWSAPLDDLNHWQCHGDSFRTVDGERPSDVPWTDRELFAPDVVCKDGKYYLYAYIVASKGAVGVSERPEGPFRLLGPYEYDCPVGDEGTFNDAGVLVDDDGRVYVYYGFTESHMNEIDPASMRRILPGSYRRSVIADGASVPEEQRFYEASSPRKIGDTYYLIYSPCRGSRLAYATSDSPRGPFVYRGWIVDNGVDYPGGNNHGSICRIGEQWYVFYHRMTNNTIMSRRACVERIQILPDGTIPPVEMTSLGFEKALNPYALIPAEIACVLKGGCFVTERGIFERTVGNITDGCVIGYKYFDFGEDYTGDGIRVCLKVRGLGTKCRVRVLLDGYEGGQEAGIVDVGLSDGVYTAKLAPITGVHSLFLKAEHGVTGWTERYFAGKPLFELEALTFVK